MEWYHHAAPRAYSLYSAYICCTPLRSYWPSPANCFPFELPAKCLKKSRVSGRKLGVNFHDSVPSSFLALCLAFLYKGRALEDDGEEISLAPVTEVLLLRVFDDVSAYYQIYQTHKAPIVNVKYTFKKCCQCQGAATWKNGLINKSTHS